MPRQIKSPTRPSKAYPVDLSGIELPRFELPDFTGLIASVQAWQQSLQPLIAFSQGISDSLAAAAAPRQDFFLRLREQDKQCERLELLGWLPHESSPFGLVKEEVSDQGALDAAIHTYYRESWSKISARTAEKNADRDIDDEAKETFAEALAAHGADLYRCAPRLLFPEIERVSRKEIHGGALDKIASQTELVSAISRMTPAQMSSTGTTGLRFYRKLTKHLYFHLKNADAIAVVAGDPVPNRHAAVHGIVSYNSPKSSLNAIFVADYLLGAISTIKGFRMEDLAKG